MTSNQSRARYSKLTPDEIKILQGHVGPGWLPQAICNIAAKYFKIIFQLTVQTKHDFGYIVGGNYYDRFVCDTKLIEHMRLDSNRHDGWKSLLTRYVADVIYMTVRMFGWISFEERDQPLDQDGASKELLKRTEKESKLKWFVFAIVLLPLTLFILTNIAIYLTILLFYKGENSATKVKALWWLLVASVGLYLTLSLCCYLYHLIF